MTIRNRMLALRQHVQSLIAGAPVWAYEPVPYPAPVSKSDIDIDDCNEVYGDLPRYPANVIAMFPEISTPCVAAPCGQCTFDALAGDDWNCCIYCGRRTG